METLKGKEMICRIPDNKMLPKIQIALPLVILVVKEVIKVIITKVQHQLIVPVMLLVKMIHNVTNITARKSTQLIQVNPRNLSW